MRVRYVRTLTYAIIYVVDTEPVSFRLFNSFPSLAFSFIVICERMIFRYYRITWRKDDSVFILLYSYHRSLSLSLSLTHKIRAFNNLFLKFLRIPQCDAM